MGAVYKARHKVLNKEVAIKVLQSANLDDEIKKNVLCAKLARRVD